MQTGYSALNSPAFEIAGNHVDAHLVAPHNLAPCLGQTTSSFLSICTRSITVLSARNAKTVTDRITEAVLYNLASPLSNVTGSYLPDSALTEVALLRTEAKYSTAFWSNLRLI